MSSLIGWNSTEGDYRMCNTICEHLMILLKDYFEKDRVESILHLIQTHVHLLNSFVFSTLSHTFSSSKPILKV